MKILFTIINRTQCKHCGCESDTEETKIKIGSEEYWNYKCLKCDKDPYFKGENNV